MYFRRNPSLTGQEHIGGSAGGATEASAISNSELEALKQEILTEMRKEMNKMKQELLEGMIIKEIQYFILYQGKKKSVHLTIMFYMGLH
jgi:hypothetical protein